MKKNNGFTLVELLVTLAIMAIVSVIIVPIIVNIREDIIENTYNDKVTNIFTAAKDWAYENLNSVPVSGACTYVLVDELIQKEYISGDNDDKTQIIDPRDGSSMNSLEVCVKSTYSLVTDHDGNTKRVVVYHAEFKK